MTKRLTRLLIWLPLLAAFVLGLLWLGINWHPDMARYQALLMPAEPAPPKPGALRLTWLGVSTLLFDDGQTAFLTDGFFSRPGALQTGLGKVAPNRAAITAALDAAGVKRLAALVVLHSHYDHAMDAPVVAGLTGAQLIGSESTAFIARGQGFDERRLRVLPDEGGTVVLGRFTLKLIASVHAPEDHFPGRITAPLVPPSKASAYKTGAAYSLLVQHDGRTLLVQASAGFVPGALTGVKAETVLLGIGLLGKMKGSYRAAYWRELVQTTGARRVVAIHWDDFFRPLNQPLLPLPWLADRIPTSLDFLQARATAERVDLKLPVLGQAFDPFLPL